MANSVDRDETASNELSNLELHCLHGYLFWSARVKGLTFTTLWENSADDKIMIVFLFLRK